MTATQPGEGGIARWLQLTDGLGLDRDYVASARGILPATRFAVDAYVHFVRERSLLEAIASSLTELFSPNIIAERVAGMLANYDFVSEKTLAYFNARLSQAPRDADFALDYVKREARTPDQQHAALAALEFKCDVLWAQLDALYHAYVAPGHVPPGAFVPDGAAMSERLLIDAGTVPRLPRHVKLRFDQARERLGPAGAGTRPGARRDRDRNPAALRRRRDSRLDRRRRSPRSSRRRATRSSATSSSCCRTWPTRG